MSMMLIHNSFSKYNLSNQSHKNTTLLSSNLGSFPTTRFQTNQSYHFQARRGMKLSKDQAIKAAEQGVKKVYRYIWEVQEVNQNPNIKQVLISTKTRILKPNSPDFYKDLGQNQLSTYADMGALYKNFRLKSDKPLQLKTWKGIIGEFKIGLLSSLRSDSSIFLKQIQFGLQEKVLENEALEQGKGLGNPHSAGKGKEPDTKEYVLKYSQSSQGESEMFFITKEHQGKNYTGTKNAEYKAEKSAEKAKNLQKELINTSAVKVQEDAYTPYWYDSKTLTTFMREKPKLDRGAEGYNTDEKIWNDPEDVETETNLQEEESIEFMENQIDIN